MQKNNYRYIEDKLHARYLFSFQKFHFNCQEAKHLRKFYIKE